MELRFPCILDGATGTALQKHGLPGNVPAEVWNLEHPEVIIGIQRDYIKAGSNVVLTPTFGANRIKLKESRIDTPPREINLALASLSIQAADGKALVAGDLAPTGKFLKPMGDMEFEELYDVYLEQAKALDEAGVDFFLIETMMSISDARAAVLAVKSFSQKPVVVSFTCDAHGKTLTGADVCAPLVIMQGMGVDGFGLNCSVGPKELLPHFKRLREYAEIPLYAKPNAGLPVVVHGEVQYNCGPEEFSSYVKQLAECGVQFFGGCCGSDDRYISMIREELSGASMHRPEPKNTDMLPAATEKKACYLRPDASFDHYLICDSDLEDNILSENDSSAEIIAIQIRDALDLHVFSGLSYPIEKPLCLLCEDPSLLEMALRRYQGRALYQGTIPEETLLQFSNKYGLIF